MVYLKNYSMLLISELDAIKKSKIKIDGMLKTIIIPSKIGNVISSDSHFEFIQKNIDNNTSILYV